MGRAVRFLEEIEKTGIAFGSTLRFGFRKRSGGCRGLFLVEASHLVGRSGATWRRAGMANGGVTTRRDANGEDW